MKNEQLQVKRSFAYNLKQYLIIFVASVATAMAIEVFLLPTDTLVGGVLGISGILDLLLTELSPQKWYLSAGLWVLALNVPIIIYSFCTFRRRFAVKTTVYLVMLSCELVVLRVCNVAEFVKGVMAGDGDTYDKVLYVLLGAVLHGLSLPMLLSVNASTGGTDIVGLMVQRHSKSSSSDAIRIILMSNALIILLSALTYGLVHKSAAEGVNMAVYSIAALFICEIVQEAIFKGFSSAIELEITTDKTAEMTEALTTELKHGLTSVKVMGGYSHQERNMLLCVIYKSQLVRARRIINRVDPAAFAYVENVKEVLGKGFANKEIELEEDESSTDQQ